MTIQLCVGAGITVCVDIVDFGSSVKDEIEGWGESSGDVSSETQEAIQERADGGYPIPIAKPYKSMQSNALALYYLHDNGYREFETVIDENDVSSNIPRYPSSSEIKSIVNEAEPTFF